jgi:hypothetical protein
LVEAAASFFWDGRPPTADGGVRLISRHPQKYTERSSRTGVESTRNLLLSISMRSDEIEESSGYVISLSSLMLRYDASRPYSPVKPIRGLTNHSTPTKPVAPTDQNE